MMILWPCMNCTVSNTESFFFPFSLTVYILFAVKNGVFTDDDESTPGEEENESEGETESTRQKVLTTPEAITTTHVDLVTDATVTKNSKTVESTTVRRNEEVTATLPWSTSNSDCDERNKVISYTFIAQNLESFNQILILASIQFFH